MILFWTDTKGRSKAALMDSKLDVLLGKASLSKKLLTEVLHLDMSPLRESRSEQGGVDQPATGPESKSEGNENPKTESEGCPQ